MGDPMDLRVERFTAERIRALKQKSIPVSPSTSSEETAIYRNALTHSALLTDFEHIKTVQDVFTHTVKMAPHSKAFGTRYPSVDANGLVKYGEYQWITYIQADTDRRNFGAGLLHLYKTYITTKQSQWFLGLFSVNRYEWVIAEYGAGLYAVPTVALYDTLGAETSRFIVNHAEVPIMAAQMQNVASLLEIAPSCPSLKVIIVFSSFMPLEKEGLEILKKWGASLGVFVVGWDEVLNLGIKNPQPPRPVSPDDIVCLQYTSGTTGNPKGAQILHRNVVSGLRVGAAALDTQPTDVYISYLPLAHIFERTMLTGIILFGASCGFYSGDFKRLILEDMPTLKPTLFVTVPRILGRIYDKIAQQAFHANPLRTAIFTKAVSDKLYYLKTQGVLHHSFYDPVVFRKVRAALGGRVRMVGCGSAAVSPDLLDFFRVALSAQILEGYGLTESTGAVTAAHAWDFSTNNVGGVVSNAEVKLVSVPEMKYNAKDLKGEVWIRGPCVFGGYFKDEAKTRETITEDGWLMTGDIGAFDTQGRLSIVDRKKNIFKMAQGEYIAPEKLENVYAKSPFVGQCFIYGGPLETQLVAIVVPDQEYSIGWAVKKGIFPKETPIPEPPLPGQPMSPLMKTLIENNEFKKEILDDMVNIARSDKLAGFEVVKAITLFPEMFGVENDLMTPTMKLKRPQAKEKFKGDIDQMYAALNASPQKAKL